MKDQVDLPEGMITQAAPVRSIDAAARTVEVVFSSGALVAHWMVYQGEYRRMSTRVLVQDGAIDLDFLVASGPVLDAHHQYDSSCVVGSVERAWIEDGLAKATLRFGNTARANEVWQNIEDGHLRNVSMGFEVLDHAITRETDDKGEEMEVVLFTRVRPNEISMVPIPADKNSRIQAAQAAPARPTGAPAGDSRRAADLGGRYQEAAASAALPQENAMEDQTQVAAPAAQTGGADVPSQPSVAEIRQAERQRIQQIGEVGRTMGLDADLVRQHQDADTSVDAFRALAIETFAQRGQSATQGIGGPRASVTQDATERFRQGALQGVLARAGLGGERNEFTGMTLAELARQSLQIAGETRGYSDRRQMVGQAFVQAGAHSTSDFANVLSNVMQKAALRGWEEAEETYQLWTRQGILTDFRPAKRVGLGLIDALPKKAEGAEYTYGTVGDRGETITLATYGRLVKVTREAIINDDLELFARLPAKCGRAARRTIGNLAYAVLTDNAAMADGTDLFHADHANLAGSGGAPSVATLGAARAAMRTQVEASGGSALNITPRYFIVPAALETSAQQLMESVVDPTATKGHAANPVANMAQVIADARLDASSTAAWYLAADPNAFDTVEVAFLDGVDEPYLEEKTAWSTDGVELKVRLDAGVKSLDWRGLYKNPGQ